jgi:hypothetical protein
MPTSHPHFDFTIAREIAHTIEVGRQTYLEVVGDGTRRRARNPLHINDVGDRCRLLGLDL